MSTDKPIISPEELREAEATLKEAVMLIETARLAFHERLDAIEADVQNASTEEEKKALEERAKELYEEYKKTLGLIEQAIEEIGEIV